MASAACSAGTGDLSYDEYLIPATSYSGGPIDRIVWKMGNGFEFDTQLGHWKSFAGFFGKVRDLGTDGPYQIRYPDGTVKTFGQEGRDTLGLCSHQNRAGIQPAPKSWAYSIYNLNAPRFGPRASCAPWRDSRAQPARTDGSPS
jgi:hypothetical protein